MPIAGQRAAQHAQRAGMQSASAMGRAAQARGGLTDELVVQRDDGWYLVTCGADGRECETPYDMSTEREV